MHNTTMAMTAFSCVYHNCYIVTGLTLYYSAICQSLNRVMGEGGAVQHSLLGMLKNEMRGGNSD